MHMLLTSLSAIYQGHVPTLEYGQRHVDQLSRAHLRYVLTGEIMPWIDRLITCITDPQNEDPEPYSKSYSAGGTELPAQELVRKASKKQKILQLIQNTPSTHNKTGNDDTNTYRPDYI